MEPEKTLSIKQISAALRDRRLGLVSEETGLHYNTLKDIRDGRSVDPRYSTVKALSKYLTGQA